MNMRLAIEIDEGSGFCYGVIRAIEKAESRLKETSALYSLGAIVHNNSELERLNSIGLQVVNLEQMKELSDTTVLIRAHGEPPTTYALAAERNISFIDCTCPVVLKLQERIRKTYAAGKGQIVIFGKIGHAEVNGLVGQAGGDAVVVDSVASLEKVDFSKPIQIFSQTTKDPKEYTEICDAIKERIVAAGGSLENFVVHDTICRQVAQRHKNLVAFARNIQLLYSSAEKRVPTGKCFMTCANL